VENITGRKDKKQKSQKAERTKGRKNCSRSVDQGWTGPPGYREIPGGSVAAKKLLNFIVTIKRITKNNFSKNILNLQKIRPPIMASAYMLLQLVLDTLLGVWPKVYLIQVTRRPYCITLRKRHIVYL